MNEIRMGVIGVGNMGSAHSKNILEGKVPGMKLAAVADIAPQKLEWAEKNLPGVPRFSTADELIASGLCDAIIVATPHYFHPTIAISGFEAGLHVLIEKPAGVYTSAVRKMNDAAKKSGKVFGIMYNQRTNPHFAKMREIVRSGELGEPKRLVWIITNWYRTQAYYDSGSWRATWAGEGGGVLLNQAPHQLDLWQWIFGMPKRVWAKCKYAQWHNVEIEDDVTAYAEYENGASATFITTTGEYPGTNRLEICGDRAKLVWEGGKLKMWKLDQPEREVCFTSTQGFATPPVEELEPDCPGTETAHVGILTNFAAAILRGEELLAPGYDGINGLTLSNAMHLSDWTGKMVELPLDEELFEKLLDERRATSKLKAGGEGAPEDIRGTYNDRWNVR